jgi:hypothetical protein
MSRKIFALSIAIVSILLTARLSAQVVLTARLIVSPVVSSYISDWERDPNQIRLSVVNMSQTAVQVSFEVAVTGRKTGLLLSSTGRQGTIKPGGNVFFPKDFINFEAISAFKEGGGDVRLTRRLPDDEWEICVKIISQTSEVLVTTCSDFILQFAVAPTLINPADGENVSTRFPLFQWTAGSVKPGIRVMYRIRVTEIFAGQSPQRALLANLAHYREEGLSATTFVYPVAALPLNNKTRYAWQVQAYDEFGNALGDNEGKSEIWTFYYEELR